MQNSDNEHQIDELVSRILKLPKSDRDNFLNNNCPDQQIRAEVESQLRDLDGMPTAFLGQPTVVVPQGSQEFDAPPKRIGPYTVHESLGEGGMGTVYRADQTQPFKRTVAIKIIKAGFDSREILARFDAERQVLARLDHPNIAKVLDAGATEARRPYFVMEHVPGDRITRFADEQRMTIRQRLDLFKQVCEAIAHAHTKGIIHRDIKASNVLAFLRDGGTPTAKVIDFGIAKALDAGDRLSEMTLHTSAGSVLGTWATMSPEQAEGSSDLDTRTDVYSLGVLLYELLAGARPFDHQKFAQAPEHEVRRMIREVDPPRPSTRLSGIGDTAGLAERRQLQIEQLVRQLRNELEWIPLKAMRKERDRRYVSVQQLIEDIDNYKAGRPLIAGPESAAYTVRKFVRRHRGAVAAIAAIVVLLVAGIAGTSWGLIRAEQRRAQAEAARALAEQRERETATVAHFQAQMLSGIDANDAGVKLFEDIRSKFAAALEEAKSSEGDRRQKQDQLNQLLQYVNATDTAVGLIDQTILKPAAASIDTELKNQPLIAASLRETLGDVYYNLGRFDLAIPLQQQALELRKSTLSNDNPKIYWSLDNLGVLLMNSGKYAEGEVLIRQALDGQQRILGRQHEETLRTIHDLATVLQEQGKLEDAEALYREAMAGRELRLGESDTSTLLTKNNLGTLLELRGKYDEAEKLLREVLDLQRRKLGPDALDALVTLKNLANILHRQGRYAEAEPLAFESLERRTRVLGKDNPQTLEAISTVAGVLYAEGQLSRAEPYLQQALEVSRRTLGEDNPRSIRFLNNYASVVKAQGRYHDAEPLHREALERYRHILGEDHSETLNAYSNLALALQAQGKFDEALQLMKSSLEGYIRTVGADHPDTINTKSNLGMLLQEMGRLSDAETLLKAALDGRIAQFGKDNARTLLSMHNLGALYVKQGRANDAEKLLNDALAGRRKLLGEDHVDTLNTIGAMSQLQARQGKYAEAEEALLAAIKIAETKTPPAKRVQQSLLKRLLEVYANWGEADNKVDLAARIADTEKKIEPPATVPGK